MWIVAGDIDPNEWVGKWPQIRFDQLRYPEKMTVKTLDLFNKMVTDAEFKNSWSYQINSSYRPGDPRFHGKGMAIDGVLFDQKGVALPLETQYAFIKKYEWGGVGLYPFWNTAQGWHVDTREGWDHVATWWRDNKGNYKGLAELYNATGIQLA
uniref:Putative tail protein n=1 Tax=viral metagenome TaxID=1070528 RepID=A0A6M3LBP0_9ZZZZ